jgi:hypothetical protein
MDETGPVMLMTRCECIRTFPELPLEGRIHIHMPTRQPEGDARMPTNTEIRSFIKTDEMREQYHLYVEEMP